MARLKPGVTLAEANADVGRMLPIVVAFFPSSARFQLGSSSSRARIAPKLQPLKQDVVGDIGGLLWILMGGISIVLLIACANVANLLLVRAEGRQQELAIRVALGASRPRIAGELLFESVVMGLLGSVLGLVLAYGALRLLVMLAPQGLPRLQEIGINFPVLLFTLSRFVDLPACCRRSYRFSSMLGAHAGPGLREGGRTLSQGRERHRARNSLVVVQVGLAFVLLICSGTNDSHISRAYTRRSGIHRAWREFRHSACIFRKPKCAAKQNRRAGAAGHRGKDRRNSGRFIGGNDRWRADGWESTGRILFCTGSRTIAKGEIPPHRHFKYISPGLFRPWELR